MGTMSRMNPFQWLFSRPQLVKICLFGSDNSGKTTILYKLKLGEIVTTIPTIGFNVEVIEYRPPGARGRWEFVFWDVGGCDRMIALMHHYITPESIVLFVHDCHDVEREEFSLELMHEHIRQMLDKGARYLWVLLNKQDLLHVEKRRAVVTRIQNRFEDELRDKCGGLPISWKVLGFDGMSGKTGEGLYEVLDDVTRTLSGDDSTVEKNTGAETVVIREIGEVSDEELGRRAVNELSQVLPADEFWQGFLNGTLSAWDHASHLQAGYLVLLDTLAKGGGIFATADVFLQHLARLRSAQPDRFRNTAHVTMTVFWLLQLNYAAAKYQTEKRQNDFLTKDQFQDVVLHTPNLMDRGLWKRYYTKDLMFSPTAKENWHLPDLASLPSISVREERHTNLAVLEPKDESSPPVQKNPDRLVEYAFEVVKKSITGNIRRDALVKQGLESLQKTTLQQRARHPGTTEPYSETQAYFWIQLVHIALQAFQKDHTNQDGVIGDTITLTTLSFPAFKSLYNLNGDTTWRAYYSSELWQDVTSRMQFVPPDLKPLPNVIRPLEESVVQAQSTILQSAAMKTINAEKLASKEILAFLADCLVSEEVGFAALEQSGARSKQEVVVVQSHAHLILHIYTQLLSSHTSRKSSSQATDLVDNLVINKRNSYTERCFWARQVMLAATTATATAATSDKNRNNTPTEPPVSFRQLLQAQPQLAYETLPFVYYSAELWNSAGAVEGFMPPDR